MSDETLPEWMRGDVDALGMRLPAPPKLARIVIPVPSSAADAVLSALRAVAQHAPPRVRGYLLGAKVEPS